MIKMIHADCMEYMAGCADKAFELAIVDTPYGIDQPIIEAGKWARKIHEKKDWDSAIPPKEYFDELFRVSENQIIWGGNYFIEYLKNTPCFIFWDKKNGTNFMADGELAWTSFTSGARRFEYSHIEEYNKKIEKIHSCQKPVALYKWLLSRYAKPGDKILDTHGGSGSICVACHDLGYDLTWMELDADYYKAAVSRYQLHAAQASLFAPAEIRQPVQVSLL